MANLEKGRTHPPGFFLVESLARRFGVTREQLVRTGLRREADAGSTGCGFKRIRAPELEEDELERIERPIRLEGWHVHSFDRTPDGVQFFVDGEHVKRRHQSPAYPMQRMPDLHELPAESASGDDGDAFFEIDYVRAHEPLGSG